MPSFIGSPYTQTHTTSTTTKEPALRDAGSNFFKSLLRGENKGQESTTSIISNDWLNFGANSNLNVFVLAIRCISRE